jgi:hypothetical protein
MRHALAAPVATNPEGALLRRAAETEFERNVQAVRQVSQYLQIRRRLSHRQFREGLPPQATATSPPPHPIAQPALVVLGTNVPREFLHAAL